MFWISLGVFAFSSVMCWSSGRIKLVLSSWVIWVAGFFAIPAYFGTDALLMTLQSILAIVLIFMWKYVD